METEKKKKKQKQKRSRRTLDLRQAALLLLRVLSDPPQVLQLRLQELALPGSLQPQVALLCQLRLQLVDTPPQGLTQPAALITDTDGEKDGDAADCRHAVIGCLWCRRAPHLQPERLQLVLQRLDLPGQLLDQTVSVGHTHGDTLVSCVPALTHSHTHTRSPSSLTCRLSACRSDC